MHKVVLIPGDGIGPEISEAVKQILAAAKAPISWVEASAGLTAYEAGGNPLPEETIDQIRRFKIALKGPLTTPVGAGFRSVNVNLRKVFNLYSNMRPAKTIPGLFERCGKVDMVLFRENTQGMYSGVDRWVGEDRDRAESTSIVTRQASEGIVTAAFDYAKASGRKKVTLVHKANILKCTSALFLQVGREIAETYPEIQFEDLIVDNMAMQMVLNPSRFDVVVTTNLFGDILSDLASGLVGGLGLTGSANIGKDFAIFEAVHGSAPDIAGQNKANPTALLFAAMMMLDHMDMGDIRQRIHTATLATLQNKDHCTGDVGGCGSTTGFADAICAML